MFKLVLALVCAFLVTIFAVQNANPVAVVFYPWQFSLSLAVVILGATLVGALIVFLLGLVQQIGLGFKLRDYRRQVQELEEHLEELQLAASATAPGDADTADPGSLESTSGAAVGTAVATAEPGVAASQTAPESMGEDEKTQEQQAEERPE